uniref:Beta-lactamase class C and other penicillin binding proteins n=1 Tax=uncultured bacterium Contig13 TaxID=1393410 RepID=W0FMH3_9BACT|nr:beta-lactamase class C and other penicillin binding proteins [uncultured bacterium Contig13]
MALKERLQGCLNQAAENREAAGLSVLVRKDGEDLCFVKAGMADTASGKPVERDSIFRLYSQTKPVTAAAAMILADRGLLDLQTEVDRYLPGFRNPRVLTPDGRTAGAPRAPWILELLGMTAGLSYPDTDAAGQYAARVFEADQDEIRRGGGMDTVTFCNRLGEQPLAFAPGTGWRYSTCADVLGAVIEVVSGKRFGQFLQEEIFDPLGMKDTGFWVPEEKRDRLVTCYRRTEDGLEPFHELHLAVGQYDRPPAFESGGAGLVSTLDDYAAFGEMLMNGGIYRNRRILSRAAVNYMTSPQLSDPVRRQMWDSLGGYNYSSLMRICDRPGACPLFAEAGEYGWDGWLGTYFINLPKEKITFLLYQNTTDAGTSAVTRKCRNVLAAETDGA